MLKRKTLAAEWFAKAQEDMRAGEIIMAAAGPLAVACFHFQQAAEKYLKAYLVARGQRFRKIHNLREILQACEGVDATFKDLEEECDFLNMYAVATRYPGDTAEEISPHEARLAHQKVNKLRLFITHKLPR